MAKKTSAFCSIKSGLPTRLFEPLEDGFVFTGGPYAYLKLGEGCMHACAFCAIPGIRGKLRSRKPAAIIEEARQLIKRGYKELNIVAQDISSYGEDFKDGTSLASLLAELDELPGDFRMRLLYGHPAKITDELLQTIANSKHICHYLDVPIQHSHPDVLRGMHRADTIKHVPELVNRIRAAMPDATVRTTCLVGFPGETDEHFNPVVEWWNDRRELTVEGFDKAKKFTVRELAEECGYNFDQCGYPHVEEEILEPMELIRHYQQERATLNAEIDSVLSEITAKLGGNI